MKKENASNKDINIVWVNMINDLLTNGSVHSPRGFKTIEILGYQTVTDMSCNVLNIPDRKLNYRFLCGEAYWILSGSNRVSEIIPFMKAISRFSDDGTFFHGAYGPKVVDQLLYVKQNLTKDPSSRQALINIWRENPRESKDIPCTVSLQFIIRDNKMNCIATMRSSDAWLGWVYDTFNFSMIAAYVCKSLNYENGTNYSLGNLYLNAGSQHLYEQHFEAAFDMLKHPGISWHLGSDLNSFVQDKSEGGEAILRELYAAGTQQDPTEPFFQQIMGL